MYYYPPWWGWSFIGMHPIWWLFWALLLIAIFGFATPVPRRTLRQSRDNSPLTILQRRYASGQMSTEEYQERKAVLEKEQAQVVVRQERHWWGSRRVTPQPQ